ncbi:predicted protein [Histoplasma capsulatum var. duboisii H88]|uniref:Predicted protein n=1 Tax=Ajellomyces capsulatus (strain H88) TaxID=544711 RepID=F0U518_AJEC8|nr:predicted protein [Histoplasma capsulatum var. duboisii H88]
MRLLENPTEDNCITFLEVFRDQFPEKSTEDKVSCEAEMAKLLQGENDLTEYYQLGVKILRWLSIKDQVATTPTMEKWIRGLGRARTRTKLIEVSDELPTLTSAYHKALNIEKAELELKKDKQVREKEKEIVWLRKCARLERLLEAISGLVDRAVQGVQRTRRYSGMYCHEGYASQVYALTFFLRAWKRTFLLNPNRGPQYTLNII